MTDYIQIIEDQWLSEMFGHDVFRLVIKGSAEEKDLDFYRAIGHYLEKRPVFIYTKIPVGDIACVHLLENEGFCLIDTNIAFERPIGKDEVISGNMTVRFARGKDEDQVRCIAGNSFKFSRFHLDPKIANELAKSLKEEWAGNYFHGKRGNEMVVVERDGHIAGFLQLLFFGDILVVDLISVSKEFRRKKIASNMIAYAEAKLEGFNRIRAGTQIANILSLRFYEKLEFSILNASYILHYHNK